MTDISRRGFLRAVGIAGAAGAIVAGCGPNAESPPADPHASDGSMEQSQDTDGTMSAAGSALERLKEGNRRFVAGETTAVTGAARRAELVSGQQPFAIILGCADSRVPVEHVFDQGLGELFVIRVAGNIATPSNIGSAEYAVAKCGTRLVVVMGHSQCGAVTAALEEVLTGKPLDSPNLRAITDNIRPAVEPALAQATQPDLAVVLPGAVTANVRASIRTMRTRSALLEQVIRSGDLLIVGAEYALDTGEVAFLND